MRDRASGGKRWTAGRGARAVLALSVLAGLAALTAGGAQAASAGLKPSEAPLVTVGQHYFGNAGHANNAWRPVDVWGLPALLTGDAITIAWHGGQGPALCLAQNIDDYDWAEVDNQCNGSGEYFVADNGSARTVIEAKSATAAPFLEFSSYCACERSEPYDFTIESIQHAIGIGLLNRLHIRTNSVLWASVDLSNGAPVPDGLTFNLDASWPGNGSAQYTATSSGGAVSFALALPPETEGQQVSFTVTRPADPQFLEAKSAALSVKVAQPRKQTLPSKPKKKPLICRKGFKKKTLHGKAKCVRVKKKRRNH